MCMRVCDMVSLIVTVKEGIGGSLNSLPISTANSMREKEKAIVIWIMKKKIKKT